MSYDDKTSKYLSEKRESAKFLAGAALKGGSAKQKKWAEDIRNKILVVVDLDIAKLLVNPNGLAASTKFWIKNREKRPNEFSEFIVKQTGLLTAFKSFKDAGDTESARKIAAEYNALTKQWGFDDD